jgi:hypothetical protein
MTVKARFDDAGSKFGGLVMVDWTCSNVSRTAGARLSALGVGIISRPF